MNLSRKILIPIVALSIILISGLLLFAYFTIQNVFNEEQAIKLESREESFYSELENREKLVLSLASEQANIASIQTALANRDREKLLSASLPSLERLKQYEISQYQFITNDGFSFLRVHSPETFGDDLTGLNPMVVEIIKNRQPVSGLDVGSGGLSMRGIAPVYFNNGLVGYIEIAVAVDDELLEHLSEEYGNEWHVYLTQDIVVAKAPQEIANMQGGPQENLLLAASTSSSPLFAPQTVYTNALAGNDTIEYFRTNNRDYAFWTNPIVDYSGNIIGVLEIVEDRTNAIAEQNNRLLAGGGVAVLLWAIGLILLVLFTQRALRPINILTNHAIDISEGKISSPLEYTSDDEVGELTKAVNKMAEQAQASIVALEQRVEERTSDLQKRSLELETVADVAREIATIRESDTLLNVSASLIRERFQFYQVSIFLIDERAEFAVLRAANGPASVMLLEQNYKMRVGTTGIVGNVARTGQAHVAQDTQTDTTHFKHPLLPDTRSEIALPLRIKSLTIGVLDIQATVESAFSESDVQTFQILADQLAAAIENANLAKQVQDIQEELKNVNRAQAQRTWDLAVTEKKHPAFEYDGLQIQPVPQNLPADLLKQLENGRPIVIKQDDKAEEKNGQQQNTLILPLMVLNQVIGVIGLEQEDPDHTWTNEEILIAQAAANRASITLENARLLEESQKLATKEQAISEATARIGAALNIENILDITAEELGRVTGNAEVILQINTEARSNLD